MSSLLVLGVLAAFALVFALFWLYTPYDGGADMQKCEHEWVPEEEDIPTGFTVFEVCTRCPARRTRPDIIPAYEHRRAEMAPGGSRLPDGAGPSGRLEPRRRWLAP